MNLYLVIYEKALTKAIECGADEPLGSQLFHGSETSMAIEAVQIWAKQEQWLKATIYRVNEKQVLLPRKDLANYPIQWEAIDVI